MDKNFKNFKTNYLIRTVLLCIAIGVSAGLLAVGIVLLSLKLNEISINAGFYVLIGVGVAALLGVPLFFLLRPDDVAVAKKIDDSYALGEKIQTMVEYSDTEGELVAIQRNDAIGRLSGLKVKGVSVKRVIVAAVAAALGLALFITSIAIPARATVVIPPPPDDVFEVTDVQLVALKQLKEDVESSALDEQPKNAVVEGLDGLYGVLGDVKQDSVMRSTVLSAVTSVDGILAGENSYLKISSELKLVQDDNLTAVAEAIVKGVAAYRTPNSKINTLARVNEIAQSHDEIIAAAITKSVAPLIESWSGIYGTTLAASIESFYSTFTSFLDNSQYGEDDGLYVSLYVFANDLNGVASTIRQGGSNAAAIQSFIQKACDDFSVSASRVLGDQTYVCMMDEFVRNRLAEIFNIRISDLPLNGEVTPPTPGDDPNGSEDDPGTNGGGNGNQDVVLGSNDMVYSPVLDAHVKYAEVINAYYAEVLERIQSGEADAELAENLRNYFQILFNGIDKDSDNNEDNEN